MDPLLLSPWSLVGRSSVTIQYPIAKNVRKLVFALDQFNINITKINANNPTSPDIKLGKV